MSKYTTEVRYICETASGLEESVGLGDVNQVISKALPKIFDFDFPIFDESYRTVLETKIIKHFYTREIGVETVGLWKLRLDTKLNEIMPYYNKLYKSELIEYNPLYTHDLYKDHKGEGTNKGSSVLDGTTTNNGTSWNKYSDTPQGTVSNIDNDTYLTNASKDTVDNKTKQDNTTTDNYKTTDEYLDHVYGFEGKDGSELLLKFRETFLNIDMQIIEELEPLFMQIW